MTHTVSVKQQNRVDREKINHKISSGKWVIFNFRQTNLYRNPMNSPDCRWKSSDCNDFEIFHMVQNHQISCCRDYRYPKVSKYAGLGRHVFALFPIRTVERRKGQIDH